MCFTSGTLEQRRLVKKTSRAFYECRNCRFVFDILSTPVPDSYYNSSYVEAYDKTTVVYSMRTSEAAVLAKTLKTMKAKVTSVLEIGPGPGWFLEGFLAEMPGVAYDIVEVSAFGAECCRKLGARNLYTFNSENTKAMRRLRLIPLSQVHQHIGVAGEI
jgi:hypothetical protein